MGDRPGTGVGVGGAVGTVVGVLVGEGVYVGVTVITVGGTVTVASGGGGLSGSRTITGTLMRTREIFFCISWAMSDWIASAL